MELKPGFKQTEVGVIPEDWDVYPLSDHFNIFAGGDVPKHSFSEHRTNTCPYPIFSNSLRKAGLYGFTGEKRAKGDSLTITGRGHIGHAEYRDEEFFPIVRLVVLEPKGGLDARFTSFSINQTVEFAIESTGVPQLTAPQVGKFLIPAPPIDEQRDIAKALEDVDTLLASLEALIQKKNAIKQASMQELLTGKRRLPGFEGEWGMTTFEKVVRHHAGNSKLIKGKLSSSQATGRFPAFSASGQDVWCNHFEHEGEAIVVSAVGSRCGKAFKAAGKWCAIANTHVVWPKPERINGNFLGFLIDDEDFWLKSGTGQPFVLFSKSFARPLRLPALAEQSAICMMLSDIEDELSNLEALRDKTHNFKQGMMQQLLTGKLRLK